MSLHKIQKARQFQPLALQFVVVPVGLREGKFAEKFKFDLILDELEVKFMQGVFKAVVQDKILPPAVADNFPDSLVSLGKSEVGKLSKGDIALGVSLEIIEDEDFLLLTAAQVKGPQIGEEFGPRLGISVHLVREVEDALGHEVGVGGQHLPAVFQFALVAAHLVEVCGHALGTHEYQLKWIISMGSIVTNKQILGRSEALKTTSSARDPPSASWPRAALPNSSSPWTSCRRSPAATAPWGARPCPK